MNLNLRTIGKAGFLLVVIGFFLPIIFQRNGFRFAELFITNPDLNTIVGILVYSFLICALAGLVIGVLLLIKKNIPLFLDWIISLACMLFYALSIFFGVRAPWGRFSFNMLNDLLSIGAIVILSGIIVVIITQIISIIRKAKINEANSSNKTIVKRTLNVEGYGMIGSLRNAFRTLFAVVIVIFVIACTIGGGVLANLTYTPAHQTWTGNSSGIHPFLGVIIGLVGGVLISIIFGGFIATIICIDINTEEQNKLLRNLGQSIVTSNKPEQKCKRCQKTSRGYSSCPHCGASDFE